MSSTNADNSGALGSNGDRRPPSPPCSPPRRRPRTPPSRDYSRNDRGRRYSPARRRNRSRSPLEFRSRDRRSRSTSRGRRDWSPRGRRRPRTPPPVPPPQVNAMGHNVPAYVPQPLYGDQYQSYGQYMPTYNAGVAFDPGYGGQGMAANPYLPPATVYGTPGLVPPPPAMSQDYVVQQPGWGAPHPQQPPVMPSKAQEEEMEQQKATLRKQREDYEKRRVVLRRELKILSEQRQKLTSGSNEPPSPTTKNFLKDNDRLQAQIENKMSTIDNVIEMLTNIIGKDAPEPPPPGHEEDMLMGGESKKRKKEGGSKKRCKKSVSSDNHSSGQSSNDEDSESEKLKTKVIESMKQRSRAKEEAAVPLDQQINYAFYDPELHWCKSCNVFPKTAKDYLQHLHSKEHTEVVKKSSESPWHENNPNVGMPTYNGAPTRRTPIRGLQFFVPATAWYCKLCSIWMGDLHCASLHLKSKCHSDSISKFVDHNPDFEVDWISERQKAHDTQQGVVRSGTGDDDASNGHGGSGGAPRQVFEGIPLQLNLFGKPRTASESNAAMVAKEPKKSSSSEKKKKKSSGKKDKKATKKKSKAHKKRSKGSGSSSASSSSSSSSSDSEDSSNSGSSTGAEEERVKALLTLTKRTIPNLLPEQTSIRNQMRKMEPENNHTSDDRATSSRRRDSPDDYHDTARRRRPQPIEDRGRSRSPGFDRYRDRGRNKSRERQYRRRDSRSRSPAYRGGGGGFRRRSRSRSRSRSPPRRIEKAVVNYPPQFKPRVQEKKAVEKRRTPPRKTPTTAAPLPGAKKLPFIGRMPVFKKQTGGMEEGKAAVAGGTTPEPKEAVEEKVKTVEKETTGEEKEDMISQNDDDDLMPDPEQFERLMEKDRHEEQQREREQEQEEEILPPGIDESESDRPKPINDAPVPRRGPLPRDLEEALNIIFPGERPEGAQPERKPFVVTGHIKDNGTEIITGPEPEDEVSQNTAAMYQAFTAYQQQPQQQEGEVLTPAEEESVPGGEVVPDETGEVAGQPDMDMDELAMLGIDASDLAAQCV